MEEIKDTSSAAKSTPAKGVVISEKSPRKEVPNTSPSKKGKSASANKGKGTTSLAMWKFIEPPSKKASITTTREGTSVNPITALGPRVTMPRSSTMAEKLLEAVIPPFDKEEVEKLELD